MQIIKHERVCHLYHLEEILNTKQAKVGISSSAYDSENNKENLQSIQVHPTVQFFVWFSCKCNYEHFTSSFLYFTRTNLAMT